MRMVSKFSSGMVITVTNISELELMSVICGALGSICSLSVRHSGGLEGVCSYTRMCVPLVVLNVKKEWKTEDEEKDRLRKERRGGRGVDWDFRIGTSICFFFKKQYSNIT